MTEERGKRREERGEKREEEESEKSRESGESGRLRKLLFGHRATRMVYLIQHLCVQYRWRGSLLLGGVKPKSRLKF